MIGRRPERHAVRDGGKRMRPLLVYAAGTAFGASETALDAPAAAVELIHAYSLVHDDLPAMDDDSLRRGKPTVHVAFDRAVRPRHRQGRLHRRAVLLDAVRERDKRRQLARSGPGEPGVERGYVSHSDHCTALLPELVLPLVFIGYLVHTPVVVMLRAVRWKHRPPAVEIPSRPVP